MQGLARAALSPRLLIHILLCAALLLRDLHTFPGVLSPEGSLLRLGGGGEGEDLGCADVTSCLPPLLPAEPV